MYVNDSISDFDWKDKSDVNIIIIIIIIIIYYNLACDKESVTSSESNSTANNVIFKF